jgi:cephalosporin-C deacetylase-like acetyl esterase
MRGYLSLLSENCYCALSIDMWYHGERNIANKKMYSKHLYQMREGLAGSVIDLRRAVDFLDTRHDEVDQSRITYLGGSMGGILGALLAGVESRIKCPVLIVGGADWSYLVKNSIVVQVDLSNDGMSRSLADSAKRILAPVDPINTVHLISPRPLLMINAKHDILVNPASNKKMFLRAKPPRKIVWFASGHGVPEDDALEIVIDWYNKYLRNDHKAEFDSINEGWKTEPANIDMSTQLPPVISSFSFSDFLSYDRDLPLISLRDPAASDPSVSKFTISFQGVRDRIVSGVLNIPSKGSGPFPIAVFIHDIGDSSSNASLVTDTLANIGYASVSIDSYQFSENHIDPISVVSNGPYSTRNLYVQTIQDNLRLIDFLEKLDNLDSSKIVFIGQGTGANIALSASLLDSRIQKVVSIDIPNDLYKYHTALLNIYDIISSSWADERYSRNALAPIDPLNLISNAITPPILFINNRKSANGSFFNDLSVYKNVPKAMYVSNQVHDPKLINADIGNSLAAIVSFITDYDVSSHDDNISYLHNIKSMSIDQLHASEPTTGHGSFADDCKVANIDAKKTMAVADSDAGSLIMNSRIDCASGSPETVIAAVYGVFNQVSYVRLYDNGQNGDNSAADGIYTGSLRIPTKGYENIAVKVGGVTKNLFPIIEKTTSCTQ